MLVVHTASTPVGLPSADLTARARIRDAAIECFAETGFDTPFRVIAARAGVSPGLITHHFGSKAALRAECDAGVLQRYHAIKSEAMGDPSGYLVERLARPGGAAVVLVYMLRAIHAGGRPASDFLESLIDHARVLMAESVARGLIRPSRDEEARTRYLTYRTMGAMLVQFLVAPALTPDEFVAFVRRQERGQILPTLELYTEGLLADRRMLDDYLMYVGDPPSAQHTPEPHEHTA